MTQDIRDDAFDAHAYLNQSSWTQVKLGLERITTLLERLGHPEQAYPVVHIAGTNGKGSTSAFTAGILQAAGFRTGLFTSPYILEFNERIQVNRENIGDADLHDIALAVRQAADGLEEEPTPFELVTAVAFEYFRRAECDIVVLEVGLGGRYDATNVTTPAVCAITPIAMDHVGVLGNTLAEIAGEKAGIIKPGVPVVCYTQKPEAEAVIRAEARAAGAPVMTPRFGRIHARMEGLQQVFSYDGINDVKLRLLGAYQPCNAVMAIEIARTLRNQGFDITDEDIKRGLEETRWPGRFELVATDPVTIVDGGHNEQGAEVLADSLRRYIPDTPVTFVMGVLKDKQYPQMINYVVPLAKRFYCATPPESERALSAEDLALALREAGAADARPCASIAEAVQTARAQAGPDDVVCCFGSLYSIATIMAALEG